MRKISRMKQYLSSESIKTLVSTFVLSRLDYSDSLMSGLTQERISKLQRAQNCAARKRSSSSSNSSCSSNGEVVVVAVVVLVVVVVVVIVVVVVVVIVVVVVEVVVVVVATAAVVVPAAASVVVVVVAVVVVVVVALRSKDKGLLEEPRCTLKTFGDRSFSKIGPQVWNFLPLSV
ncbi:hypothetical protein ElyMa_002878300, partial [Elysia marginata]